MMVSRVLGGLLAVILMFSIWLMVQRNHCRAKVSELETRNATLRIEVKSASISDAARGQITRIEQIYKEEEDGKSIGDGNITFDLDRMW